MGYEKKKGEKGGGEDGKMDVLVLVCGSVRVWECDCPFSFLLFFLIF